MSAPSQQAESLLELITNWARARRDISGVALVGSHARGTARVDSDIDLVLLTPISEAFRADESWVCDIDWSVGARPVTWRDEDYGNVWSRRIWLSSGAELEISFAPLSWADVNPLDAGTRRVISDGCRILHDPDRCLDRLCRAIKAVSDPA
jgi:predicted nucleotidyltransferase